MKKRYALKIEASATSRRVSFKNPTAGKDLKLWRFSFGNAVQADIHQMPRALKISTKKHI